MLNSILLLLALAFIAFSLSAVCGGGAGLLLMPALGLFIPTVEVPAALSLGTLSSSTSRLAMFFAKIRWDVVRWFVPAALPAVFLGALLLQFLNPIYLEIIMALFLISNLRTLFNKQESATEAHDHSSPRLLVIIGALAGFLSGLTGAVGLLFNRFYLRYGMTKEEIVATRAANELLLHLIKLVLYISFGLLSSKSLIAGASIAVAGLFSSWFMRWGLPRISELFFRRVGYASMVLSGFFMLVQSGNAMIVQNQLQMTFAPISKGVESKIQWQQAGFTIEFEYNEGFEYEQVVPLSDLPPEKQKIVFVNLRDADRVVVEEVFGFNDHSYEAYYFHDKVLREKIDFK